MTSEELKLLANINPETISLLREIASLVDSDMLDRVTNSLEATQREIEVVREVALRQIPSIERHARLLRAVKNTSEFHEMLHQYKRTEMQRILGIWCGSSSSRSM